MKFKEGQYVMYQNGSRVEIGKIKRFNENKDAAFVWYHAGGTAACTPLHLLMPIENDYIIKETLHNSLD